MATTVGQLIIQLNADTNSFTRGLTDAKQFAANSTTAIGQSFGGTTKAIDAASAAANNFKAVSGGAGDAVGYSMMEARHSVMLLGEEFGVHLPRALTSFIAGLGPIGAGLGAAFPFLAIVVGATLLIEHLSKIREEAEKLSLEQSKFGTTIQTVFNTLDDKLLQAGIHIDELNGNHLAALQKQLELIDHQTLKELVAEFDILAKAADAVFAELKSSWGPFESGSAGAKHSLEEFKAAYDFLLAQGKDEEANKLLADKVAREKEILALQQQAQRSQAAPDTGKSGNYQQYESAVVRLRELGVGLTEKEMAAQQALVTALGAQVTVQEKLTSLKTLQDQAATQTTGNTIGGEQDRQWRAEAQSAKEAADLAQKAWEESYRRAVSALQESEKEKISATAAGSQQRIAAVDAAIKEEESKGLQDTQYYKALLIEKINAEKEYLAAVEKVSEFKKKTDEEAMQASTKAAEQQIKNNAALAAESVKGAASAGVISKLQEQQQLRTIYAQELSDLLVLYANEKKADEAYLASKQALVAGAADPKSQLDALKQQDDAQKKLTADTEKFAQIQQQLSKAIQGTDQEAAKLYSSWGLYFQKMKAETNDLGLTLRKTFQSDLTNGIHSFSQGLAQCIVEGKNLGDTMMKVGEQILESIISVVAEYFIWQAILALFPSLADQQKTSNQKNAMSAAALAAANTLAITSAVYLPPAPEALAATAYGVGMTFAGLASAAGGMVVGEDQLAMVHKNEHILPARLAQTYDAASRGLSSNGGGGSSAPISVQYSVSAIDAAGVKNFFRQHGNVLAGEIQRQIRNRNLSPSR